MRVHKEDATMVQIHRRCDARISFEFRPSLLHTFRIMDIVQYDNSFLCHAWQQIVHVAFGRFVSMVGIHIDHIEFLARVFI